MMDNAHQTASRETWPGPRLWDEESLGENRGGTPAGERARQRTGRRKPITPWRDPHPLLVRGLTTVHLPAFRFLLFRHCERSEVIQCGREALDCFVAMKRCLNVSIS
jgi:hypothetical protein